MRIPALSRFVLVTALVGLLAACSTPTVQPVTIASIAAGDAQLSTLVAALTAADLVDTLANPNAGPFTVFAPTNAGFTQFLADAGLTAEQLLASPDLADILRYHVVPGTFLAADVIAASPFAAPTLLANESIDVAVVGGGVLLDCRVNVVTHDIVAANGVIHVVDYVLDPNAADPTIAQIAACDDDFSHLTAALEAAGLLDPFADPEAGPFMVFAPTNAAVELFLSFQEDFDHDDFLAQEPELIAAFLRYHVSTTIQSEAELLNLGFLGGAVPSLLGPDIMIGDDGGAVVLNPLSLFAATVVQGDISAANGVIHVIDVAIEAPIQ